MYPLVPTAATEAVPCHTFAPTPASLVTIPPGPLNHSLFWEKQTYRPSVRPSVTIVCCNLTELNAQCGFEIGSPLPPLAENGANSFSGQNNYFSNQPSFLIGFRLGGRRRRVGGMLVVGCPPPPRPPPTPLSLSLSLSLSLWMWRGIGCFCGDERLLSCYFFNDIFKTFLFASIRPVGPYKQYFGL